MVFQKIDNSTMLKKIIDLSITNQVTLTEILKTDAKLKVIPASPGIYALWWVGDTDVLKQLCRDVQLQGKVVNKKEKKQNIDLEGKPYHHHKIKWDWNMEQNPVCMYVGKTNDLQNRLKQHLELGKSSEKWYTEFNKNKKIIKPQKEENILVKRTTACQIRAGIEHLFKNESNYPSLLEKAQFFAYSYSEETCFKERFYLEDLAVGYFRPWFNIDSER